MATTRKQKIEQALGTVYAGKDGKTKGTMIEMLAEDIDLNWNEMKEDEYREFEQELTNRIWNWYSGGGTAAIAAQRVIEAVGDDA